MQNGVKVKGNIHITVMKWETFIQSFREHWIQEKIAPMLHRGLPRVPVIPTCHCVNLMNSQSTHFSYSASVSKSV